MSQCCTKECVVIRCFAVGVSDASWQECAGEEQLIVQTCSTGAWGAT